MGGVIVRLVQPGEVLGHSSVIANNSYLVTVMLLTPSGRAKLAQLLLGWVNQYGRKIPEGVSVLLTMTQEETGETIGTSRETVTRLLAELKRSHLIRVKGSSLVILQSEGLRDLSDN